MTGLHIALTTGAAAALGCLGAVIWWADRRMKSDSVRVDGQFVYVGSTRKAKKLAWADIVEISIVPLYDVAPADDCWLLQGKTAEHIGFFGRDNGAAAVLAHLQSVLPGFDVAKSLKRAHAESIFEEEVLVWRANG
ncbi:hypothetical protein KDH83_07730 [Achromobacter sp. Marseille-Q0513]|uniref:hypothetical protein n=1 Tax=Achromobacter sp. Marseille-Q0513 TaxID=2829161 RepID=UPI001BA348CD|nr:hypothetical protein [Achromobacter sp. Marseille-Q0513]MBR8653202.1 hypothetical protein [Achromobacter sp. Marseille-Q0513]